MDIPIKWACPPLWPGSMRFLWLSEPRILSKALSHASRRLSALDSKQHLVKRKSTESWWGSPRREAANLTAPMQTHGVISGKQLHSPSASRVHIFLSGKLKSIFSAPQGIPASPWRRWEGFSCLLHHAANHRAAPQDQVCQEDAFRYPRCQAMMLLEGIRGMLPPSKSSSYLTVTRSDGETDWCDTWLELRWFLVLYVSTCPERMDIQGTYKTRRHMPQPPDLQKTGLVLLLWGDQLG